MDVYAFRPLAGYYGSVKRLKKETASTNWLPDILVRSVAEIDFALLQRLGIKQCFIDIDGTITDRRAFTVSDAVLKNLQCAKIPLYIATNRIQTNGLEELAQTIGAKGFITPVGWRGKPSSLYYQHALAVYDFLPEETLMIGDRLLQDVWGANRAHILTLFITHRFDAHNSLLEHMLDKFQRWLIQRWQRLYEVFS